MSASRPTRSRPATSRRRRPGPRRPTCFRLPPVHTACRTAGASGAARWWTPSWRRAGPGCGGFGDDDERGGRRTVSTITDHLVSLGAESAPSYNHDPLAGYSALSAAFGVALVGALAAT